MIRTTSSAAVCLVALLILVSATGCGTTPGLNLGILAYPIPVSPFYQDQLEDQAWEHERYDRVTILGPITAGGPAVSLDPPSEDEIMRALESARPIEGGLPFLHGTQRDNVRIVIEPISDHIDPPRDYPLIGPAQLHHAEYKCIVHFSETTHVGWPIPHTIVDEEAQEVIYIDHDHLHMVGNVDGGPGSYY